MVFLQSGGVGFAFHPGFPAIRPDFGGLILVWICFSSNFDVCRLPQPQVMALFFRPAVHHSFVDVEEDSIDVLSLVENLHMVRETNTKEIVTVDIGRHWRPVLKRE